MERLFHGLVLFDPWLCLFGLQWFGIGIIIGIGIGIWYLHRVELILVLNGSGCSDVFGFCMILPGYTSTLQIADVCVWLPGYTSTLQIADMFGSTWFRMILPGYTSALQIVDVFGCLVTLAHLLHPAHKPTELNDDTPYICDGCKIVGNVTRFSCASCQFDLHHVYSAKCPTQARPPPAPLLTQ
ncbi:hypothetical protein Tco_0989816 [Tanacetum coccineum]|uniref:Palmitoyltransferase n=1 Tax=Tanacetum coccineum TaxID=301880 RepID=A0ABQ5EWB1_9ASTR